MHVCLNLRLMSRLVICQLAVNAATMESASASRAWSSRCSLDRAAAVCALLAAALAKRSALSLPYIPT